MPVLVYLVVANRLEDLCWCHFSAGSRDVDPDIADVFGPLPLGRANSALEVAPAQSLSSPLPYMPQWQSESVPAELPNQVVNRLLMSGTHDLLHRNAW